MWLGYDLISHSHVCFIQGQPIHLEWNPFEARNRSARVRERSEAHLSHRDRFKGEITSVCYGCSSLPASVKNTQLRSREAPWGTFTGWDTVPPPPFSQLSRCIQQRTGEGQSLQNTCTAGALCKQCKTHWKASHFIFKFFLGQLKPLLSRIIFFFLFRCLFRHFQFVKVVFGVANKEQQRPCRLVEFCLSNLIEI